jgi:(2Fe-2S) ferredoxin
VAERRFRIIVCRGPECGDRRDSRTVYDAFARELAVRSLGPRCELAWQSCFGRCSQGPNVLVREVPTQVQPPPRFALADLPPSRGGGPRLATALYNRIDPVKVVEVVASHVGQGRVVGRFIERPDASTSTPVAASPLASPLAKPPGESDV